MRGVDVYYNLHRRIWSIRSRTTGLVESHARVVTFPLGGVMIVRPAGRAKVLETGAKNIHAFVRGIEPETFNGARNVESWHSFGAGLPDCTRVTYNPFKAGFFTRRDTGERIDSASAIVMVAPQDAAPEVWAVPA